MAKESAFTDHRGTWYASDNFSQVPYYINSSNVDQERKSWFNSKTNKSDITTRVQEATKGHGESVVDDAPFYEMTRPAEGGSNRRVIIIDNVNNETSKKERKMLRKVFFDRLEFEDYVPDEKNSDEMMKFVKEEACADYRGYSCLVFIIFSYMHPKSADLLRFPKDAETGTVQFCIDMEDIVEPFRATKSLVGKPKLFFFRQCTRLQTDHGGPSVSKEARDGARRTIRIPAWADTLSVFCPANGPDFVTHFCKEFGICADETTQQSTESAVTAQQESRNILKILTRANRKATLAYVGSSGTLLPKVASFQNSLTKLWLFS